MDYRRIRVIVLSVIICTALVAALAVSGGWILDAATRRPAPEAEEAQAVTEAREIPIEEIQPSVTEETVQETMQTAPETEPVKMAIDTVPQYFQTNYPDVRYGTGTIADSGCNMTALAMVASYMTDHIYYPDELADYTADFIGSHVERLDYGSDMLQLSWRRAKNFHDALNALKEGKVVIAVMNETSLFTSGQHFIVWTGMTEDGKILVNDPNDKNYDSWNLKEGFETGFREGLLLCGFAGGWIYDKSEMPEDAFIYEPVPYAEECRYPDITLTEAEMDLIARLLCAEAASEPFEGQQAIVEVILNRLASGRFQKTVHDIIFADNQFAGADQMYKAVPTYSQYKAIERAMYGPYIVPEDVVFFAKFAVNKNVWGTIGAHTFCHSY